MIMDNIVARDLSEYVALLQDMTTHIKDSTSHIKQQVEQVKNDEDDRADGLSFLEMKSHLFLNYLINLTYTMLLKVHGKPLDEEKCIERLVTIRTVLEKIRPTEKKLSYQIDKLIKMASGDLKNKEQHPLSFKPNLDNLMGKDDEVDDDGKEEASEDDEEDESAVYVPPKVTAVMYDDDDRLTQKQRKMDQARKRSLNNSLLQDLQEEYGDAPEEIRNTNLSNKRAKLKEKQDERQRYEEDNMRRLMLTKKDKMMNRQMNQLDEVIKLGNFQGLGDDGDNSSGDEERYKPKSKKRKGKFGPKTKKFNKRMQKKR